MINRISQIYQRILLVFNFHEHLIFINYVRVFHLFIAIFQFLFTVIPHLIIIRFLDLIYFLLLLVASLSIESWVLLHIFLLNIAFCFLTHHFLISFIFAIFATFIWNYVLINIIKYLRIVCLIFPPILFETIIYKLKVEEILIQILWILIVLTVDKGILIRLRLLHIMNICRFPILKITSFW